MQDTRLYQTNAICLFLQSSPQWHNPPARFDMQKNVRNSTEENKQHNRKLDGID